MTRSGASENRANRIATPYTGEHEAEKQRPRLPDLLLREQGVAPEEPTSAVPAPGPSVPMTDSLVGANDLDFDLDATSTGKTEAPPRPDARPDDSAMLRRLDATRRAAVAYLARTDGKR